MERFEYKVLTNKIHGVLHEDWFEGDELLGKEMTSELLNRYGADGWEVCAAGHLEGGSKLIILKRRVTA